MTICLVDTSILCELLEVPSMCRDPGQVQKDLKDKLTAGERLMLPMATIFETGNHIGQNGDGRERRRVGMKFVKLVSDAILGKSPFRATRFLESEELLAWLAELPEWANRGSGLGDLAIAKEWEELCGLSRGMRRVYIWSLDEHLSGYDLRP